MEHCFTLLSQLTNWSCARFQDIIPCKLSTQHWSNTLLCILVEWYPFPSIFSKTHGFQNLFTKLSRRFLLHCTRTVVWKLWDILNYVEYIQEGSRTFSIHASVHFSFQIGKVLIGQSDLNQSSVFRNIQQPSLLYVSHFQGLFLCSILILSIANITFTHQKHQFSLIHRT